MYLDIEKVIYLEKPKQPIIWDRGWYIDIMYIYVHVKSYVLKKAKMIYNFGADGVVLFRN
jgi:hypothetical protein